MIDKRTLLTALGAGLIALIGGTVSSQDRPADDTPPQASAPMSLGAAANFSQGWSETTYNAAAELGVVEYRDSLSWADVERTPGEYVFVQRKTQYPARLAEIGGRLVLTVAGTNPLYDNGQTPHSPEAVAALARFVAAVVQQYPAVSAVEVGNEFNSGDFVNGPVRDGGIGQRARYHLALLQAVAREVRKVGPELPILGGATHSMAAGYLWSVLDQAEPGVMDGLAVHPYTTDVDQLPAQTRVLRRNPRAKSMPIQVTEFGTKDEASAPDHMLRGYAAMASLGFSALHWYPLNERGDGMVPLILRDGSVTGAGEAFRFIQAQLAARTARDISPDRFTFVHAFSPANSPPNAGADRLVLWGDPRPLALTRDDIEAFDARGNRLDAAQLALSRERAVILTGSRPLRLGDDVVLGCNTLLADSFYQFDYPQRGAAGTPPSFIASLRLGGEEQPLVTLPGQQRPNVPWLPYLGLSDLPGLRLTADSALLPRDGSDEAELILRWVPPSDGPLRIEAKFSPPEQGGGPFAVELRQAGRVLFSRSGTSAVEFDDSLALQRDDPVEIRIIRSEPEAVRLDYRVRIHDGSRC